MSHKIHALFLSMLFLLTGCFKPTPPTQPAIVITVVREDSFPTITPLPEEFLWPSATPLRQDYPAEETTFEFSMLPPGSVILIDRDGSRVIQKIDVEWDHPAWDAETFPKGFIVTLYPGRWVKYLLGTTPPERGYSVDINPLDPSAIGARVIYYVMPEFDGEDWVDVLWLIQPKDTIPLRVYVKVYPTDDWPVATRENLKLSPGVWQGYTLGPATLDRGYVTEVNPLSDGSYGDTLQRMMINPEYGGTWEDALRIQIPKNQLEMEADVIIYDTSELPIAFETILRPQPGEWAWFVVGKSSRESAYILEVTPLGDYDAWVDAYWIGPEYNGLDWYDVVRVHIPADRPSIDVQVRLYAVAQSQAEAQAPTTTPTPAKLNIASLTPTPGELLVDHTPFPTVTPIVSWGSDYGFLAASFPNYLIGNAWQKFFLSPVEAAGTYLVDVTPFDLSLDGAHIEWSVRPEFERDLWVDSLWIGLPTAGTSVNTQVDVYGTQDWPVFFRTEAYLEPGRKQGIILNESASQATYVVEVNPLSADTPGAAVQDILILPEYSDGTWWDVVRMEAFMAEAPVHVEVVAYRAPDLPVVMEIRATLEPGVWHGFGLGPALQRRAYLVEVNPLSEGHEGDTLERLSIQAEYNGREWNDMLRIRVPQGQEPIEVLIRVYAVGQE